jgi:hypothetical protein
MKTAFLVCVPVLAGALLLTGCGAGGGGGGEESPATTALVAGQSASFRIAIPDMVGVTAVEALVGTYYDDPDLVTVPAVAGPDGWAASLVLPDPLPASCRVLVRVTAADGGVQESGLENFAIPMP